MIFKGDLSKFYPPDLLMFLTHLDKEGVLTVNHEMDDLNIWIKKGTVVDASSKRADGKLLRGLFVRGWINAQQLKQLQQIKKETGIPYMEIGIESTDILYDITNCCQCLLETIRVRYVRDI